MAISKAEGTQSQILPYIPDHYEMVAHRIAGRFWEKWPRSFLTYARQERYPWRMWRTFSGLLVVGMGRPRFQCKVSDIALAAGQHPRTTQRALVELEIDGWIERQFIRQPNSRYNLWTRYTLPHLLPQ